MNHRIILLLLSVLLAFGFNFGQSSDASLNSGGVSLQPPPRLEHIGMCDASAAVAVGSAKFIVASDEDNKLRVYRADQSGEPTQTIDVKDFMKLEKKNKEADIEASAVLDGKTYFITSHGRNKDGEVKLNRYQFFAVEVKEEKDTVAIKQFGEAYTNLLKDMLGDARLKDLIHENPDLPVDPKLAPQQKGALNIEGLTLWKGNQLLIAFRNPVPDCRALLVPLENPTEVVSQGKAARLGVPFQLDLGGQGIRSIEYWEQKKAYIIVTGSFQEEGVFGIYRWSGEPAEMPKLLRQADLTGLNPEAIVVYPQGDRFQILSDDGGETVEGKGQCKDLNDADKRKKFRSMWIDWPAQ